MQVAGRRGGEAGDDLSDMLARLPERATGRSEAASFITLQRGVKPARHRPVPMHDCRAGLPATIIGQPANTRRMREVAAMNSHVKPSDEFVRVDGA